MKKSHILQSFSSYDWRGLKRLFSAQANDDLNRFMDVLPYNVGQTMIYILASVWIFAGGAVLYTMIQMQAITQLRAELMEVESLRPDVPEVVMKPLSADEVKVLSERMSDIYRGLTIKSRGPLLTIESDMTANFGEFRESVSYAQAMGSGWRADIENLCVGRECEKKPLSTTLKINRISVN